MKYVYFRVFSADDSVDAQQFMADFVLRPLMGELRDKRRVIQSENVHILSRVSRIAVYTAKHLPVGDFDNVFLAAVATSCQLLESRIPVRRDKGRAMLCDILKSVGTKFFRYVVKEIESRTVWGRWKHVLGYSVCDILAEMDRSECIAAGSLDHATKDVTTILMHDIAGAIGAEKVLATRRYRGKEAGDSRAPEAFEIMAKSVTFNPHIHLLLAPMAEFAARTTEHDDWRIEKVKVCLERIKEGLLSNGTVKLEDLIAFNYRMICEQIVILKEGKVGLSLEPQRLRQPSELRRPKQENTPFLMAAPNRVSLVSSTSNPKPSAMELIRFCLELLLLIFEHEPWWREMARSKYSRKQMELVPTLCLRVFNECPSEQIHVYVLRLAMKLAPLKLRTFGAFGRVVVEYSMEAITRTEARLKETALMLLSAMLRTGQLDRMMDDNALDVLLQHLREHLVGGGGEGLSSRHRAEGTLHLLHSVLDRKLKSPLIYELMLELHGNLSRLSSSWLTRKCSECLSKFLVTYPLSDRALRQHFENVVGSLQHPLVMGRLCGLQMMQQLLLVLPTEVIDVYALVMFMAMMQLMANERDRRMKRSIQYTLRKYLLPRIENDQFWEFWTVNEEWVKSTKCNLRTAALQSVRSFVTQQTHSVTKQNLLAMAKLMVEVGIQPAVSLHCSSVRTVDYGQNHAVWKPAYLALLNLQCILGAVWEQQPDALRLSGAKGGKRRFTAYSTFFKSAFEDALKLMTFPHRWIRTVCCKVLGWYLSVDSVSVQSDGVSAGVGAAALEQRKTEQELGWIEPSADRLYVLAQRLCVILQDLYISESLCSQSIRCLLFLTLTLHRLCPTEQRWIVELKEAQQATFERKLADSRLTREQLKAKRREYKKERKAEIERMRKEKADWFTESGFLAEDDTAESAGNAEQNELKEWLQDDDEKKDKVDDDTKSTEDGVDDQGDDENVATDKVLEQSLWIAEKLQFDGYKMRSTAPKDKADNWRLNEIFKFMATRIQDADTTLDVQWMILQWFAAVIVRFEAFDLRLYDYYVITVLVYMLKQRRDPSLRIELKKQYLFMDGKDFDGVTPRERHECEMYVKCVGLARDIMRDLKAKIGDSQFVDKFYRIETKRENQQRRQYRQRQRAQFQEGHGTKDTDSGVTKKKRKRTNKKNDGPSFPSWKRQRVESKAAPKDKGAQNEDWVSFLWSS